MLHDLAATFAHRTALSRTATTAFRCVQRGELSAVDCAIDCYGDWLCVWGYDPRESAAALAQRLAPVLAALHVQYGTRGGVVKCNRTNPHQRGLVAEHAVFGEPPPEQFSVTEHGAQYGVTLTAAQHVGLFLDQRDNRLRVRQLAAGRRVANLFSYTCSFSVVAALGGAAAVTSVDVSGPSLDIGRQNFALNGLDAAFATFRKQDVRDWLAFQVKRSFQYDLIICDPPTFATTRTGGAFALADDWPQLVRDCRAILADGGDVLFCNNHQGGPDAQYRHALTQQFVTVDEVVPPCDFPRIAGRAPHVRMWWCR